MEGRPAATFSSKGKTRLVLSGKKAKHFDVPPLAAWTVRVRNSTPARVVARIVLVELPFGDKAALETVKAEWKGRGVSVQVETLGSQFGVAGKVIDNRKYFVLAPGQPKAPEVQAVEQAAILKTHGVRTTLLESMEAPSSGTLEVVDAKGSLQASSDGPIKVEAVDTAPLMVRQVEFGVGYDFHGFEDRTFRGNLEFSLDRKGQLAVINVVSIEDVLRGLVPSEIFARAHPEALKAQAVTARGEVLAKIGLKHLADNYFLCSEQHCAVYKGLSGEQASTNAAVDATRGEALFANDGRLVDSVYSAICGGHTEDNDIVWGGPKNPSLRGRLDVLPGKEAVANPSGLKAFLDTPGPYACKHASMSNASKFRWEKRFTAAEVDAKTSSLGLGKVYAMAVTERGVSGRARLMTISGELGATQIRGELTIRRLFGMLNSAMFELTVQKDAKGRPTEWVFRGGGWGHGVGMCQIGAIGRAEAGQNYREILGHYFNGALVARIYAAP